MNPERLLAHFDRLAEVPDAIPRLRRFILDLAVRGKLVEQDPNDEPASELLKRINAEKARLGKAGEIRKQDAPIPLEAYETPFKLPKSWQWIRVGEGFNYDAGIKHEPKELVPDRWLLELEDIEKDTSVVLECVKVSDRHSLSTKSEFRVGDILYGKLRPYLNKVVVATQPGYSTTEIVAIRPFLPLCSDYCCLAFRRPDFVDYVERLGRGTKMPRLRTPDALAGPFPLPPLAEQHRIVAKVDELMGLCDRLEASQAERERRRDRLDRPDGDARTFCAHAGFHLCHLPRFTVRPDQIPALRQTILSLAAQGRLVPQDPKDQPVSVLMKALRLERRRLWEAAEVAKHDVTGKTLRNDDWKNKYEDGDPPPQENLPVLPPTWLWVSFDEIVAHYQYGPRFGSEEYVSDGIPTVRTTDMDLRGRVDLRESPKVRIPKAAEGHWCLQPNDLLITRTGATIGKCALYQSEWGPAIASA